MKNILITGGAGYIGSHTVKELLKENFNVIVYDNLSSGHRWAVLKPAKLVVGDLLDEKKLDSIFKKYKPEAVMNFAGSIEAGESMKRPGDFYKNNCLTSLNLLETVRKNKVKYFIFSSSAAVYGEPKKVPIKEDDLLLPINTYGETKRVIEEMLKFYEGAYNIKSISLRYFNAAGADPGGLLGENHNPETHLVPLFLKAVLKDKPCYVFGNDYKTFDGTCIRDYIHVTDLARAHILALKYLKKTHKSDIFNLGNGKGNSVLEVIKKIKEVTGINFKVKYLKRRIGDPDKLVASSKKAEEVLKWKPQYNLEAIIKTAWGWKKNKIK